MFTINSKDGKARTGVIKTKHGSFETPVFIPVATAATVKALSNKDLLDIGGSVLLANTYHLHLRPGEELIKRLGGLHKFMSWDKPLVTDSGGFQVFSLGFGMEHNVGKVADNYFINERNNKNQLNKKINILKNNKNIQELALNLKDVNFESPNQLNKFLSNLNKTGRELFDNRQTRYFIADNAIAVRMICPPPSIYDPSISIITIFDLMTI